MSSFSVKNKRKTTTTTKHKKQPHYHLKLSLGQESKKSLVGGPWSQIFHADATKLTGAPVITNPCLGLRDLLPGCVIGWGWESPFLTMGSFPQRCSQPGTSFPHCKGAQRERERERARTDSTCLVHSWERSKKRGSSVMKAVGLG